MNISDVLRGLGILLVILGIIFVYAFEDILIPYSLLGVGVTLNVISRIMRRKKET